MKKVLIWAGWLGLVALNWAALHDILKGERNVWMECGRPWSSVLPSWP